MSHTPLAALIIDINRPTKESSNYTVELKRRPEPAAVNEIKAGPTLDADGVIHEVEKALQVNFMRGIPIEFRSKTYETIEEALQAVRTRRQEWE